MVLKPEAILVRLQELDRILLELEKELRVLPRLDEDIAAVRAENQRLSELSQQTKDAIPSIFYERHDYSGRPGQSVVVLNGKALKAGGSPASGVRVEEILPDSVVLDYRGTEFRLRALNSWVNL